MSPTGEQLQVAVDSLRAESKTWDISSNFMRAIAYSVRELEFTTLEGGIFAPFISVYSDIIDSIETKAKQAEVAMEDIGTTLIHVANTYQAEEAANEHALRGLY